MHLLYLARATEYDVCEIIRWQLYRQGFSAASRDRYTRTPLVDAILNWILTLTPHTDHKGRCTPPRSIVGQRFQASGHTRSVYEVTGAIGHRHNRDNAGRSKGHFWTELQWQGQAVTLDEIIDSLPEDNTYMFMGSRSARWSNPSETDHDTAPGR